MTVDDIKKELKQHNARFQEVKYGTTETYT
jgi:hypothetical protein